MGHQARNEVKLLAFLPPTSCALPPEGVGLLLFLVNPISSHTFLKPLIPEAINSRPNVMFTPAKLLRLR